MVRQGDSDLMAYYDEVERKLTLVTNKIVMSHNTDTAAILNKEVRDDALHAFIAGLKRTLKTLVLPAQPKDLPSALALAREAENSIERSAFAASYAKAIEEKSHFNEGNRRNNKGQGKQWRGEDKNPHFIPKQNQRSIFQRAIDDVLREEIGKICYVYVDDVIIFSENETEHVKHIDKVLKRLLDANMRVAREKTKFFKECVEFLGLTIISIILLSTASARITDFSQAKYIPVLDGNVLVWEQYGLVRHSTNLSEFASIIDSTVRMLELFPHSHMRKLLEVDIEHAQNLLEELKLTEVPIVSLMDVSKIKIFQNNALVHVIVQYPRVKRICKKVLLFPVAHYHAILQIEDNIVAECDDGILAVSDCASTNLATFCKKASHDTCARQLHAGGAATCRTRPSNLEPLTIVDDGVIIVNEKLTRITIDDGPTTTIVGTHLITFERKAVINDSVYLNLNYSVNKSPGIAASPLINITGHDHILSLPMLQRMNEHNLRLMQELREDVSAGGSPRIWFAAGVVVSLTLCALVLLQQHCRRKREAAQLQKSIDELAVTEDGVQFKGGVVNNQLPA
ncbi:hypothetical protein KR074_000732 [Drosophila pseudoananassae]|nr:hypothetical protein KR074_000732 [Drosophila pseudoananassae]